MKLEHAKEEESRRDAFAGAAGVGKRAPVGGVRLVTCQLNTVRKALTLSESGALVPGFVTVRRLIRGGEGVPRLRGGAQPSMHQQRAIF